MKPVIRTLWIGSKLSIVEQTALASFVHHGHEVVLYCYGPVGNIPQGVLIEDASKIVSKEDIYTYPNGSYAAFADLFRWEVLYQHGGCWVDTDVICLKPFEFDSEYIFGRQDTSTINIAVMGLPKGSEFAKCLSEMCREPNKVQPFDKIGHKIQKFFRRYVLGNKRGNIRWGEGGGVKGFTRYAKHSGIDQHTKNFLAFYPVHAKCWGVLFDGTVQLNSSIFSESYAVHLWNENLRKNSINKSGPFPKHSFIMDAAERFI